MGGAKGEEGHLIKERKLVFKSSKNEQPRSGAVIQFRATTFSGSGQIQPQSIQGDSIGLGFFSISSNAVPKLIGHLGIHLLLPGQLDGSQTHRTQPEGRSVRPQGGGGGGERWRGSGV